jgi:hypothetical protein
VPRQRHAGRRSNPTINLGVQVCEPNDPEEGIYGKPGQFRGACSLVWIGHRVPNPVVEGSNPSTPDPPRGSDTILPLTEVLTSCDN